MNGFKLGVRDRSLSYRRERIVIAKDAQVLQ